MAMRPSSRMARKLRNPAPGAPSRFSAGMWQPSSVRPCVSLACQPSLRYAGSTISPGVPASTRNAEMPSGVRAVTVITDVIGVPELVMNALLPSSAQPSRSASPGCASPRRRCRRRVR